MGCTYELSEHLMSHLFQIQVRFVLFDWVTQFQHLTDLPNLLCYTNIGKNHWYIIIRGADVDPELFQRDLYNVQLYSWVWYNMEIAQRFNNCIYIALWHVANIKSDIILTSVCCQVGRRRALPKFETYALMNIDAATKGPLAYEPIYA